MTPLRHQTTRELLRQRALARRAIRWPGRDSAAIAALIDRIEDALEQRRRARLERAATSAQRLRADDD